MGSLFDAYLSKDPAATSLYRGHFANAEDRRRAVLRARRPLMPSVADALEAQQAALPPSPARSASLAALRRGAATVVTGQQVGLFLGPLYTLYKAASAVRWAHLLTEETGEPVVPVFWLQTEDHDLLEIAQCHAPSTRHGGSPLTVSVPASAEHRISIAHCVLPDSVTEALRSLSECIGSLPHADAHLAQLARHYRPGVGWAAAFAGMLAEIFAETGLVFVNPRDSALARLAAPIHRRAIEDAQPLSAGLRERVAEIERQGWEAPIHVREGAPLSFVHPEGPGGPRFRMCPADRGFSLLGAESERVYSKGELLTSLDAEPLRFSTSALLRPILQDTLLPTAAYIGGPAEVAYFAQVSPLYDAYGLPMPLVAPRARFRVLDEQVDHVLKRFGLGLEDISASLPEEALLQKVLQHGRPGTLTPERLENELGAAFEETLRRFLEENGVAVSQLGLERPVAKTTFSVRRAASKFRRKFEKALVAQERAGLEELVRVRAFLLPENQPQERHYGISWFAARHGGRAFLDRIISSLSPLDPRPQDLRP